MDQTKCPAIQGLVQSILSSDQALFAALKTCHTKKKPLHKQASTIRYRNDFSWSVKENYLWKTLYVMELSAPLGGSHLTSILRGLNALELIFNTLRSTKRNNDSVSNLQAQPRSLTGDNLEQLYLGMNPGTLTQAQFTTCLLLPASYFQKWNLTVYSTCTCIFRLLVCQYWTFLCLIYYLSTPHYLPRQALLIGWYCAEIW